ncbi:hypothetical protein [Kitasatospora purpeofusca]|uniref:hypothetical protein n=1 Tax=Kitasatospora purpeofusca TaxID=67352 RepID=UPI00367C6A40
MVTFAEYLAEQARNDRTALKCPRCYRRRPRLEFRETPWHGRAASCKQCEGFDYRRVWVDDVRWRLAQEQERVRGLRRGLEAVRRQRDAVHDAVHVADEDDVTDWQRGYRACAERAVSALNGSLTATGVAHRWEMDEMERVGLERMRRADRFELAWTSARRRAGIATSAWRHSQRRIASQDEYSRGQSECIRALVGRTAELYDEGARYQSAWLSARRRAGSWQRLYRALLAEREHRLGTGPWVTLSGHQATMRRAAKTRSEDGTRMLAFVADLRDIRQWAFPGFDGQYRDRLEVVWSALREYESALSERRRYRSAGQRRS